MKNNFKYIFFGYDPYNHEMEHINGKNCDFGYCTLMWQSPRHWHGNVALYLGFLPHHLIPFNQNLTMLFHQHQHNHYHHINHHHVIALCYHGDHIVVVETNEGVNL